MRLNFLSAGRLRSASGKQQGLKKMGDTSKSSVDTVVAYMGGVVKSDTESVAALLADGIVGHIKCAAHGDRDPCYEWMF
jgi:hypothetical protein